MTKESIDNKPCKPVKGPVNYYSVLEAFADEDNEAFDCVEAYNTLRIGDPVPTTTGKSGTQDEATGVDRNGCAEPSTALSELMEL